MALPPYTPDPDNSNTPTDFVLGGYAAREIRALKAKLNNLVILSGAESQATNIGEGYQIEGLDEATIIGAIAVLDGVLAGTITDLSTLNDTVGDLATSLGLTNDNVAANTAAIAAVNTRIDNLSLVVPDGSITTAKLANNAVTEGKLASNAVNTSNIAFGAVTYSKLNTSIISLVADYGLSNNSIVNGFFDSGDSEQFQVPLAGEGGAVGTSCFLPVVGYSQNTSSDRQTQLYCGAGGFFNSPLSTSSRYIAVVIANKLEASGQNRTGQVFAFIANVDNCPPYDIGNGTCGAFCYILRNKDTGRFSIIDTSSSPAWVRQGSTDIASVFEDAEGKQYASRVVDEPTPPWQGGDLEAWQEGPITELVELTPEYKNTDMFEFPHPFTGDIGKHLMEEHEVVLVDPNSDVAHALLLETQNSKLESDRSIYDNLELLEEVESRLSPSGVKVMSARWRTS